MSWGPLKPRPPASRSGKTFPWGAWISPAYRQARDPAVRFVGEAHMSFPANSNRAAMTPQQREEVVRHALALGVAPPPAQDITVEDKGDHIQIFGRYGGDPYFYRWGEFIGMPGDDDPDPYDDENARLRRPNGSWGPLKPWHRPPAQTGGMQSPTDYLFHLVGVGINGPVIHAAVGKVFPTGETTSMSDLQARIAKMMNLKYHDIFYDWRRAGHGMTGGNGWYYAKTDEPFGFGHLRKDPLPQVW